MHVSLALVKSNNISIMRYYEPGVCHCLKIPQQRFRREEKRRRHRHTVKGLNKEPEIQQSSRRAEAVAAAPRVRFA